MNGQALLIGVRLAVLAGCFSYTMPLEPTTASVGDVKQGQDCKVLIFGVGSHSSDRTMTQAIRLGDITKLQSAEYRMSTFQGFGTECVVAHGE